MQNLEEDLQYVLDLLHKLAFASLTPRNIEQLRDAAQCITDIRDASSIAQEIIWILEDNPGVTQFNVAIRNGRAQVSGLETSPEDGTGHDLAEILSDRLSNVVKLCLEPARVEGWSLSANRSNLMMHLDARRFDAGAVLSIVAPEWTSQLVHRIDQATSHHEMVHNSRQRLKEVA